MPFMRRQIRIAKINIKKKLLWLRQPAFPWDLNTCNLEQTERLLKGTFEFYHDKTALNKKKILTDLEITLQYAGKHFAQRRALVNESTTILSV